jgi:hypothetical protein
MVVMVSARGDADEASALGASLGRLLHGAVAENLGRAESAGLDETGRAKADEIRRRADQASNVLQRNLSRAPPAARAGLQRAIEASQHGHQRAEQGGKGKGHKQGNTGPPWGREEGAVKHGHPGKGKGALPPGLQRKRAKDRAESTNSDQ